MKMEMFKSYYPENLAAEYKKERRKISLQKFLHFYYVGRMNTTANPGSNSHHYKLNKQKVKAKFLLKPTHTKKIT